MDRESSFAIVAGGRRLAWAVVVVLACGLSSTAIAQHVVTEPPRVGAPPGMPPAGGGGTGGGAGLLAPMPELKSTLPSVAPVPVPTPPAVAVPAVPATPVVRFRCEVAPEHQSCREPGAKDDGGGGDDECSCARDYCHTTAAGMRVCEKLQ